MPIFCPLSKKTLLSCPYFVEKMSILSETVLLCQCFQNFHQKPLAVMPIFDQKRQFYLNYTILWAKKVNMMHFFFPISQGKIIAFMPIFCKKRPFSKKHAALKSRFCQKNGHSVKNTVLPCHFFKFFMTNPLLSTPYLVKKNVNTVKMTLWYRPKTSIPFFSRFSLKSNNFHAHILSEKHPLPI